MLYLRSYMAGVMFGSGLLGLLPIELFRVVDGVAG